MDPLTILTAFIPVISDAVRAGVNKLTGGAGAKPANTDEAIRLMDAEVRRLEALSKLDKQIGPLSVWVNNVRALQRPTIGLAVICLWGWTLTGATPPEMATTAANLASAVAFYLFGERTLMYARKAG